MSFLSQFTPYSFPTLGLVRLPEVQISDADKMALGLKSNVSTINYLKTLAWRGFLEKERRGKTNGVTQEQAKARLKMEFEVFEKTGTISYILLIYDIIQWCDRNKISRGPGRGSCAASYAFFCLGISQIDSIRFDLTFTRFISEARVKPQIIDGVMYADGKLLMDVDIDISYEHRSRVIKYVEQRYPGHVAKIANAIGYTGKLAIKEVSKAFLEYDETTAKRVSDNLEVVFGTVESLETAEKTSKELQQWLAENPKNRKAFNIARGIENLNKSKGTHASGIFVYYAPLDGNVPTEMAKSKEHGDVIQIVYSKDTAALIGPKIDLLGVRTLDVIRQACDLIRVEPDDIDFDDPAIYEYFSRSDLTYGLFQVEEGLTKSALMKIKPRNIDQLAAVLAISRPGSLKYIDDFAKYTNQGIRLNVDPRFESALGKTGNILIYQEQVSRILTEVYGLTPVESENMRRIIGKKDRGPELKAFEPVLYERGRVNNLPDAATKYFWDVCNASADYLFNSAHSASYSLITAYTTYLKAKHPREFVYALLKMSKHETKPQEALQSIIVEAKQMGIAILPPDLVKSQEDFVIEETGVRFGLSHIRGVSDANMKKLTSFRRVFSSRFEIFEAAKEAKINIAMLTGLIYAGVVSIPSVPRTKLAMQAQMFNLLTDREKKIVDMFRADYEDDLIKVFEAIKTKVDEKGKPYIKDSRLQTIRRDFTPYWQMYKVNSSHEELCAYIMERHYLGFSYSNTLHNLYSRKVPELKTVAATLSEPKDIQVSFIAFVNEVKKGEGKTSKKKYVRFELSDETGKIKAMLSGNRIEGCEQFNTRLPTEGDVIVVHGSKADSADLVFASNIVIQNVPIKLKRSGDIEMPTQL